MEGELWKQVYAMLTQLGKGVRQVKTQFPDVSIVAAYLWAVLHDRPTTWALYPENWPKELRPWRLPSDSTMSRRLRTPSVQRLMQDLERHCRQLLPSGLYKWIDAKPLPIGSCSKDRQAGYGRAGNGKAKGYKLYAICDSNNAIEAWRIGPMHTSEQKMAKRLLPEISSPAYVVGDGEYDSGPLHAIARQQGLILVSPKPSKAGAGHRRQRPERLEAIERYSQPFTQKLLRSRGGIERVFGHMTCWGAGIKPLPAWVRTHRRVVWYVRAKLIFCYLRRAQIQRLRA